MNDMLLYFVLKEN